MTTTPSMPIARRSSLLAPRTPARVASGRKVGTGEVPRRSDQRISHRASARRRARSGPMPHRRRCTRVGIRHQLLEPTRDRSAPFPSVARQAVAREADHGVPDPKRREQAGGGSGVLAIERVTSLSSSATSASSVGGSSTTSRASTRCGLADQLEERRRDASGRDRHRPQGRLASAETHPGQCRRIEPAAEIGRRAGNPVTSRCRE